MSDGKTLLLQDLPDLVLEHILRQLKYNDILKVRLLSRRLYDATVRLFRSGYYVLEWKLRREMDELENVMTSLSSKIGKKNDAECKKYVKLALKHAIFRVLHSEYRIIKAYCERYIRKHVWHFVSWHGGEVLDEYYRILYLMQYANDKNIIEPEVTSTLFDANEKFLLHFEGVVEPNLCLMMEEQVPFEVKCIDILDCAKNANFRHSITYEPEGYTIDFYYLLRDVSCIDFPFNVYTDITTEKKLKYLLCSLRNNVRWSNFCYPLKELWALEDALERNGNQGLHNVIQQYQHYHMESKGTQKCCDVTHAMNVWLKENNTYYRNEFYNDCNVFVDKHGVHCRIQVNSKNSHALPLDLEFVNRNDTYSYENINSSDQFKDTENKIKNEIEVYIKVQYPSLDNFDIKETIIFVSGIKGIYSIRLEDATDNTALKI